MLQPWWNMRNKLVKLTVRFFVFVELVMMKFLCIKFLEKIHVLNLQSKCAVGFLFTLPSCSRIFKCIKSNLRYKHNNVLIFLPLNILGF
jgi:hypothetical protein